MDYYIKIATPNKAKADIDEISQQLGYTNLSLHDYGSGGVGRFLTKLCAVFRILTALKKGDVLFLQYPMKKFYKMATVFAHAKGAKVVTVIHDLGAFRRHKLTPEQENRRLSKTDFLICHNDTMASYLRAHGFKGRLHSLEIFDYLAGPKSLKTSPNPSEGGENNNCSVAETATKHTSVSPPSEGSGEVPVHIVYAGNLGMWRNEFLYHLDGVVNNWIFDLYGNGFDAEKNVCKNLVYHGFIASDDFISKVHANFGLVWDGASVDECTGAWGEYLKINNPHKTSFYLRAGIPVIVWSQAAMAPFVIKYRVGIVIDSIRDIDKRLKELTADEYKSIHDNAVAMSKRLADGYYIKAGLKVAHDYFAKR